MIKLSNILVNKLRTWYWRWVHSRLEGLDVSLVLILPLRVKLLWWLGLHIRCRWIEGGWVSLHEKRRGLLKLINLFKVALKGIELATLKVYILRDNLTLVVVSLWVKLRWVCLDEGWFTLVLELLPHVAWALIRGISWVVLHLLLIVTRLWPIKLLILMVVFFLVLLRFTLVLIVHRLVHLLLSLTVVIISLRVLLIIVVFPVVLVAMSFVSVRWHGYIRLLVLLLLVRVLFKLRLLLSRLLLWLLTVMSIIRLIILPLIVKKILVLLLVLTLLT